MSTWQQIIFDDFVQLKRGYDLPNHAVVEGVFPVVASTSIKTFHKEYKVKGPGVVTGRSGSLGAIQYVASDFWPLNTTLYVQNFRGNDRLFVKYFLHLMRLENFNSGAGVPTLNQNHLRKLKIRIPPPAIQKKITAILSAYDDLIENNKRRIALLEKMAEEIYREWFVRMRFPGHEKAKFVKGVPASWRVAELRELAAINPSTIGKRDGPETISYIDIGSVTTSEINEVRTISLSEAPGRARRSVRHGDIIWSSVRPGNRAYCLIYEPPPNTVVSTGFAVIRPSKNTPFIFLKFAVTSDAFVDQMTMVAKGAAYPATSFEDFEKAKLIVPSSEILDEFQRHGEPLYRQKYLISQQNELLTNARNLLLPRLISGKLPVEDFDIQFPPSMREEAETKEVERQVVHG